MSEPLPFSPESIRAAISSALTQTPLPPGKRGAVIGMITADGIKGIVAVKVGEHWQAMGDVELHGDKITGGASVVASW